MDINKQTFLTVSLGFWGRGKTIKEAALNLKKSGCKAKDSIAIYLILGDNTPAVDSQGYIVRDAGSENILIGNGFKLNTLCKLIED